MSELQWEIVQGRRVLRIRAKNGDCNIGKIDCVFYTHTPAPGKSACMSGLVCIAHGRGADTVFITEEQLPEYLAQRLTGQS